MIAMLRVEIRRCFARRLVRALIGIAVIGCAGTGVIAWREAGRAGSSDPFRLVELWIAGGGGGGDSPLGVAAFFLLIGAVIGGASMVGAEWRAGTFVTLLTWEPNRARVAGTKLVACGVVAAIVAVALQALFCLAFLPAAWGPGTTAGAVLAWFRSLVGATLRIAAMTGLAATLMASVAMIGRNTSAALGAAFGYLIIVENLLRALKPWTARFLLGENGAVFVSGADLTTESFTRSTAAAGLTLTAYVAIVALVAAASFWSRDLAVAT